MRAVWIAMIAWVGLVGCSGPVKTDAAQSIWRDVAYGEASGRQTLDAFVPPGEGPFPVIVYIHGGGFFTGNKTMGAKLIVEAGLAADYAVASVGYRLSGEAVFPAAIDDVQAAIVFLKQMAGDYGLDPDRIAVWGASAGGHLAAMAAVKGEAADNTAVQTAVDWFGPIRFDEMDAQFAVLGLKPAFGATGRAGSPESKYLGEVVGTPAADALVTASSPLTYISPDDPPFLIQRGTADRNIPITQSELFAAALSKVIGAENVAFDIIGGAGHGGAEFQTEENMARIFAFLDSHLK
ncbi:MAG: alpha/beta hydrolase [Pseudomonadota bacterium]